LKNVELYDIVISGAIKKQGGWRILLRKGGEAMSNFEIIVVVFNAVTIVIALIRLMIYLIDLFSKRK